MVPMSESDHFIHFAATSVPKLSSVSPFDENGLGDQENLRWGCNVCDFRFCSSKDLSKHASDCHGITHPSECRLCCARFACDAELGVHIKSRHIQGINSSRFGGVNLPAKIPTADNLSSELGKIEKLKITQRRFSDSSSKSQLSVLSCGTKLVIKASREQVAGPASVTKKYCRLCNLEFTTYDEWREHVVFTHIFAKNPYPIVEMNFIGPKELRNHFRQTSTYHRLEQSSEDSSSNSSDNILKEKLRLTICKNNGKSYMVKKSSVSDESEVVDENSDSPLSVDMNVYACARPAATLHSNEKESFLAEQATVSLVPLERQQRLQLCNTQQELCEERPGDCHPLSIQDSANREFEVEVPETDLNSSNNSDLYILGPDVYDSAEDMIIPDYVATQTHMSKDFPNIPLDTSINITDSPAIPHDYVATTDERVVPNNVASSPEDVILSQANTLGNLGGRNASCEIAPQDRGSNLENNRDDTVSTKSSTEGREVLHGGTDEFILPNSPAILLEPQRSVCDSQAVVTPANLMANEEATDESDDGIHGKNVEHPIQKLLDFVTERRISEEDVSAGEASLGGDSEPEGFTNVDKESPVGNDVTSQCEINHVHGINCKKGSSNNDFRGALSEDNSESSPQAATMDARSPFLLHESCQSNDNDTSDSDCGLRIHLSDSGGQDEASENDEEQEKRDDNRENPTGVTLNNSLTCESDDFMCRVCGKNFLNDDAVKKHFSEEHFRVGMNSNILEPESPAPVRLRRDIFEEEEQEEQENRQEAQPVNQRPVPPVLRASPEFSVTRDGVIQHGLQAQLNRGHQGNTGFNPHRPPLSSAPTSYEGNFYQPRSNYSAAFFNRPPQLAHSGSFRPTLQQSPNSNAESSYPSSLHNALTSMAPGMTSAPQCRRPTGIIQNAYESDGPRIVEVTSMNSAHMHSTYASSSGNNRSQNSVPAHQPSRSSLAPHTQPSNSQIQGVTGHFNPIDRLAHMGLYNAHDNSLCDTQPSKSATRASQGSLNLQAKRSAADGFELLAKRSRLEVASEVVPPAHMGYSNSPAASQVNLSLHRNRQLAMNSNDAVPVVAPARISPSLPRHMPPHVEINTRPTLAAGNNSSSNLAGIKKLGNAITLSVCPTSETQADFVNISRANSHRPSNNFPETVASSLAVRGVTVTPAQTALSPNTSRRETIPTMPGEANSQAPVGSMPGASLTRVDRNPAVSPVRNASPPVHSIGGPYSMQQRQHQFAIPRLPAPRAAANPSLPSGNHSLLERPDRPPTVDLTEDSPLAYSHHRTFQHGYIPTHPRPSDVLRHAIRGPMPSVSQHCAGPPRPPISCQFCGALCNSTQAFEEHKATVHGIIPPRGNIQPRLSPPSRPVNESSRYPQHSQHQRQHSQPTVPHLQQPTRTQSPSTNGERIPKNLCIPILDFSKVDSAKLRRLEDMGITGVIPLAGNDRTAGQMGIPIMPLRHNTNAVHLPWDSVLPLGPAHLPSLLASATGSRSPNIDLVIQNHRMTSPR